MVFCRVCKSILIPIVSTYFSKFLVILQRAHKTAGITSILLRFQSLWISLLRFWYFSIFYFSLSTILLSLDIATSITIAVFSLLLTITICGPFSKMTLSHCTFKSHISLWLTFSLTVWGLCRYHFSDFSRLNLPHSFQWTIAAALSCLFLCQWVCFLQKNKAVMVYIILKIFKDL